MEIVISIVAKIAEYTVAPIGRQLGYLFLYNRNINDLKVRHQDLVDARKEIQHRVDEATNRGCEIEPVVSTWFRRVDDTITKLPNMSQENESGLDNPSCFNVVQRYQRSRKATKKGKEISELMATKEKFQRVGYPVPLSGIRSSNIPENYQFLESRTSIAKQIQDALANPNFNRIGLYGMGGVGKTTLLNEVEKLVLEDKLFDQVIKVTIGQTLSVEDIQAQMGDKLRLELGMAESKQGRADLLRNKLEVGNKILVILDDLWNELDLVDVGIPCGSNLSEKGSKILITSRKRKVLTNDMDIKKHFQLKPLSEEESWKFFSAIVGEFDEVAIEQVAKMVAKECGGLPLALVLVAKTLRGERSLPIWRDHLFQLENPIETNIEGVTDQLYSIIKRSYTSIKSAEARLLFLLCSLFPDDYEISVENLQMYAVGMGLLNRVNNWCEARNRVLMLVDNLISSSLLLECNDLRYKYVKMHDVVRDIAIQIAWSDEANMSALTFGDKHLEWPEKDRRGSFRAIFGNLTNFHYLPQNLEFQNLELLILQGRYVHDPSQRRHFNTKLQISNTFFVGMEKLRVLDLSNMYFQELSISLTHTLMENLQIFCMRSCRVKDINIISKLKKLQILRIKHCPITHLPATMSKLIELKVLEVSDCKGLHVIPLTIFSSMTKLEELDLSSSFRRWGEEVSYENKLIKNVTLQELKDLPHLISLKLDILDERMLQDLLFLQNLKLENFCLRVGDIDNLTSIYFGQRPEFSRSLAIKIGSEADVIDRVFGSLWQRCERLSVEAASEAQANFRFKANEKGLPSLSKENPENGIPFFDDEVAFPELKCLKIAGGNNSKMVWHDHSLIANYFCKLQTIELSNFYSLRYIFSSNVATALVSLNSLRIEACELLERIFEVDELTFKQKEGVKVMPLKKLYLKGLLNLKCVWNKDPTAFFTFPNLQEIEVFDVPQLQSIFPATFINHVQKLRKLNIRYLRKGVPLQLFSEDKSTSKIVFPEIVFPSLTVLTVGHMAMTESVWFRSAWFPRLRYLSLKNDDIIAFPREMNQIFYNIEHLNVYYSSQLVQVFPNEEENNNHTQRSCANLKRLHLYDLHELRHVWTDSSGVSLMLDNLETLWVNECGKLKCIAPPSITFLNLKILDVSGCDKLMNLVSSSSMAKTLVKIKVEDCREMTTCIFAGDREEEDNHGIVFSKLEMLRIEKLPRLESFYPGKCKLVFPCLKQLMVDECPTMKIFSHGTVSTPKLEQLEMNGSEVLSHVRTKHDINDIFQDIWWRSEIMSIRYLFTQQNEGEE